MEQKMEYAKAIKFFEDNISEIQQRMESNGHPSAWVAKVPVIDENSSFLPKGKTKSGVKTYLSQCPHYNGLWLCGGFAALSCNLVSEPMPGIIGDIFCYKNSENCTLKQTIGRQGE